MSFWKFKNAAAPDVPDDLYIDGEIIDDGDKWMYDYFKEPNASPIAFRTEMKKREGKCLNVHINSPGGNVFAGIGIYDALRAHKGKVNVCVSFAASIASVIAMAGDSVEISPAGMMMIHNPSTGLCGDAKELRKAADVLDKVRDAIASAYEAATELTRDEIIQMMDEETYLTASDAVKLGFADKVQETESSGELTYMRNMVAMLRAESSAPTHAEEPVEPETPSEAQALALEKGRFALRCKMGLNELT